MQFFILGLAALVLLLVALQTFVQANPRDLARQLCTAGAIVCVAGGVLFSIGRQFQIALPLFLAAFWLFSRGRSLGGARRSPKTKSEVRTSWVVMELDHDTGNMGGEVLKGLFSGRRLETLGIDELTKLWHECRADDDHSGQLIEAYLERMHPNWRDSAGAERASGTAQGASGPMSIAEAYSILGLEVGASAKEIHKAHRDLMKRFHPDRGGSTYLASKINEAKDLLLKRA